MFINIDAIIIVEIPEERIEANTSREDEAMFRPLIVRRNKRIRRKKTPINPHSSAKTEKMKSDALSGRNPRWLWGPFKNPIPNIPPPPIAIFDWVILYPEPNGSND